METGNNVGVRSNNRWYFGFTSRLLLNLGGFVVFLLIGTLFVFMALEFNESKSINYTENSNLDYRVYLRPNDFYETEYLGKNMVYVASLIDKVAVDFNYDFKSEEDISLSFNYTVVGKLSITDTTGKNTYFEKTYILLDRKDMFMENGDNHGINERIDIDYGYYNSFVNQFKNSYGVGATSNLVVDFIINKDNGDDTVNDASVMSITIPLSEKSVNITMDYKDINNTSNLIRESKVTIDSVVYLIMAIIIILLAFIMMFKMIKLLKLLKINKSMYDGYVNKLLNEYDRLIVETSTCPNLMGDNVIKINDFHELLDVRDNLKLPIMYYVVVKHQKCYFYIAHDNKIYLNVVKAVDIITDKEK